MKKILLSFLIIILFNSFLFAADITTASIESVEGDVKVNIFGIKWEPAYKGTVLYQNSKVKTEKESYCEILFSKKRIVKLKPETEISISELEEKKGFFSSKQKIGIKLDKGFIYSKVKKLKSSEQFKISTPTAVCGVRGTEFATEHQDSTKVSVIEGIVESYNPKFPGSKTLIKPGQYSVIKQNQEPVKPKKIENISEYKQFAEKKIITKKVNVKIVPVFKNYNINKLDDKNYEYQVTISNIDVNKQIVVLLLYLQDSSEPSRLIGKFNMNLQKGNPEKIEETKTFSVQVTQDKPGKYSYKFSIEKK